MVSAIARKPREGKAYGADYFASAVMAVTMLVSGKVWAEPGVLVEAVNELKYLGGPEVYRDSTAYLRNFSAILNANKTTITEFRGIPSTITVKSSMSLGANSADSQWVYAHLVATNSVIIQPGFKVGAGATMRITVGDSGGSLAKRAYSPPEANGSRASLIADQGLSAKYDQRSQNIIFTLNDLAVDSRIKVSVYDIKGNVKEERMLSLGRGSLGAQAISIRHLPHGVYVLRAIAGKHKIQQQLLKW